MNDGMVLTHFDWQALDFARMQRSAKFYSIHTKGVLWALTLLPESVTFVSS